TGPLSYNDTVLSGGKVTFDRASATAVSGGVIKSGSGGDLVKVGVGTMQFGKGIDVNNLSVTGGKLIVAKRGASPANANNHVAYVKGSTGFGGLSIDPASALDLNDNDLVVSYGTNPSAFNDVRNLAVTGYRGSVDPSAARSG